MSKSYTHTPENMLETHTGGARSQSNLYNGDGQRVQKEEGSDVTESKTSGYSGFENKLQHIGAIHDELTGPLYLNARYYEPRTGRFITRDSYRGERENADTWHLYAYCAYTPINYVDSLYLQTCWYLLQKG